jgi:hypothetical protein
LFLVVIGGGGAFLFWKSSQSSKKRADDIIEAARAGVKTRLDDVANDIIDLEDEVALSDDSSVQEHYEAGTSAYAEALKGYKDATTPEALMQMAEELDIAIWRLDCADAILDGEPAPPKPEKPAPSTQRPPPSASDRSRARDADPFDVPPPRIPQPAYRRPERRRSSGTFEMLQGLLIGSMMSSSGGGRRRPATFRSRGTGRMRGGGRRRG